MLQEYFNLKYTWYARNKNYDAILGLAILAYNLCVMFNVLNNRPHRKVADAVLLLILRHAISILYN